MIKSKKHPLNLKDNQLTRGRVFKSMFKAVLLVCFSVNTFIANAKHFELSSPNKLGLIKVEIDAGKVFYTYSKNGTQVIQKSLLGIDISEIDLQNLELTKATTESKLSSYKPLWGTQETYPDNYNTLVLQMLNKKLSSNITFHFRLYDQGLAFKYKVDSSTKKVNKVVKELTEFHLPKQSTSWILNHPWGKKYQSDVPIAKIEGARLPLLSKSPENQYVLITEASLYQYGAASLSARDNTTLGIDIVGNEVQFEQHLSTPWRVVMAAQNPADFIENNFLIQNLNVPSKIKDTSWIKPGITTWDWRARGANEDGFTYQLNTQSMLRLVEKTESLGLPYFMIDAGWYGEEHKKESNPLTTISDIDMPKILEMAKLKKVGIWLYINRAAFEDHDMDVILSKYKEWGIVGIKLGFLRKSDQQSVEFLQHLLEKSAKYKLMFNCHECVIPSGIERTWPHFLTREYNHSFQDGSYTASPIDHTITPFLNNVAGPIDVTPGFFDIDKIEEREYVRSALKSTVVAQTAMTLTYFSPVLCLPDIPEAYQRKPELFDFIKSLPLTYDETKVLNAEIGKSYVVARRKSDTWWIGGVANEQGASLQIPLSFLNKGEYKGTLYLDGKNTTWENNREGYTSEEITVNSSKTLKLEMAKGGGAVIKLEPALSN